MKKRINIYHALVFVTLFHGFNPARAEDRLWMDGKINGKPVKFIFDTGASGMFLFAESAKRLGLKFHFPNDPGLPPTPRAIPAGIAEECEFTFIGQTMKMQFNVLELQEEGLTEADGVLGWGGFKKNVFYIHAGRSNVVLLAGVPEKAMAWKQFRLLPDTRIVVLEVPQNGITNLVLLDTGAEGGLYLATDAWRDWKAAHPEQRLTLSESYMLAAGASLRESSWADKMAVGPLLLKEIPVSEAHPGQIRSSSSVASIGLRAMRQLQIVIDGKQGIAYVHVWNRKPEPYEHNRLGAVFIPSDPNNENDLVAHVVERIPAHNAGIRNGDALLKIGDFDVTKWQTDTSIRVNNFWKQPQGTEHRLTLKRGQQTNQVVVKLENILGPDEP